MKRGREVEEVEAMAMANSLMLLSKVGQTDSSKRYQSRVFACKTCNKSFSSFQALGGHRASHNKLRLTGRFPEMSVSPKKPTTHKCSICGLEFPIGQALGGHMRKHKTALNEELVTRNLLPDMKKSRSSETSLCLDLSLTPWGTDLELKVGNVTPTPVVHCFI
ncbi:hypothetical protein CRYUN_Cryun25bG0109500 [Craigia yunnanensis]